MNDDDPHRLTTAEQVRAIIGAELPAVRAKLFQKLDETAIAFIQRSPFLLPASWPQPLRVSFGKLLARRLGGGAELEGSIDRMIEDDYKNNL